LDVLVRLLERQAADPLLCRVAALVTGPFVREAEDEIRHRHDRRRGLEGCLFAHREMSGYETAMAPAHDAEAIGVDVRERLEVVDRREHVVELLAAVVDRAVKRRAVARAAAIIR